MQTMEQDNIQEPVQGQGAFMKNEIWEWIKALLIAAALVSLIRLFIFAPFIVEGGSMEPNFHTGERLIVNKLIYDFRKPERGEIVIFHAPAGLDYIKRVIALPGETVKIQDNKVYVNGKELNEPYIQAAIDEKAKTGEKYNHDYPETQVPEGTVFVLGDNRLNSTDSRKIGPVPDNKIVGRADIRFWPLKKIRFIRH